METQLQPPRAGYEHCFAIVRVDEYQGLDALLEERITVKKVVRDAAYAEAEVKRLNDLNRDKNCLYFMQLTRLQYEPAATAESCDAGSRSSATGTVQAARVSPESPSAASSIHS